MMPSWLYPEAGRSLMKKWLWENGEPTYGTKKQLWKRVLKKSYALVAFAQKDEAQQEIQKQLKQRQASSSEDHCNSASYRRKSRIPQEEQDDS